jgi:uncharacterized protein YndB with AHSA1/START domain
MGAIRLERTLRAPIDGVFDLISDHADYKSFRGVTSSELTRPGDVEPNGAGAVRRIAIGPIAFEEEITAFERPVRMDYLIRRVNLPLVHDGGRMMLEPTVEGTRVLWVSTFGVPLRFVGEPLGGLMAASLRFGFASMLAQIERRLS